MTTATADPGTRQGLLAQTLQELLTVGVRLRSDPRSTPTEVDSFRASLHQQVGAASASARQLGYRDEDIGYASYAVVAYLDETVLGLSHPALASWKGKPLQEEMFGVFVGGDVFFDYLGALLSQADSADLADVLEVYQLCLLLGFRGRYGSQPELLHTWTSRIASRIAQIRGTPGELAPEWRPSQDEVVVVAGDPWQRRLRLAILGAGGLTVGLFLIFMLILGSRAGSASGS